MAGYARESSGAIVVAIGYRLAAMTGVLLEIQYKRVKIGKDLTG